MLYFLPNAFKRTSFWKSPPLITGFKRIKSRKSPPLSSGFKRTKIRKFPLLTTGFTGTKLRKSPHPTDGSIGTKLRKFLYIPLFLPYSLFAQDPPSASHAGIETASSSGVDFMEALLSASIIVQITFLILIIMSVVSWAIILQKYFFFKKVKKVNIVIEDVFFKDGSFEEIYSLARSNENSPLSQIFVSGYTEMQKIFKNKAKDTKERPAKSLKGVDNVERALRKACENELSFLESGLSFLATVGSSGPFIGLFGTVFGIMNSFNKIALMGSASLNVVAPGIAEALLATGVGLFAAIPASIFYNSYLARIRQFDLIFNNFITDFLNIAKRNFFQDKD